MDYIYLLILILSLLIIVCLFGSHSKRIPQFEGYLSSRIGPVDMLQQPKQLLMDGYRFQDALFPQIEGDQTTVTECQPIDRQRVGIFKEKAYIDPDNEPNPQKDVIEGYKGASIATVSQLLAKGEQDIYLYGRPGDPIVDSEKPFSMWVRYGQPERKREVNYPNEVFSWGDVINRYHGKINLT